MNGSNSNSPSTHSQFATGASSQQAKRLTLAIFLCAGIGVWICGSLLKVHDGGWQINMDNATLLAMPCISSPSGSSSCGAITSSRWGSFDFLIGHRRILVPASLIGLVYFMAIILWFVLQAWPAQWSHRQWQITRFVQWGALIASMLWLTNMATMTSGWCIDCIIAHCANAAIVLFTMWLRHKVKESYDSQQHESTIATYSPNGLSPYMTVICIAFVGAGSWLYFDATTTARHFWRRHAVLEKLTNAMQEDPSYVLREFYAQPINTAIIQTNDEQEQATVDSIEPQLTVFTDYENRASRCFEATLGGHIRAAFGNHININFKHLPTRVVSDDNKQAHEASQFTYENLSCKAAVAALEEGGVQAFTAMRRELLVNRRHHSLADVEHMAESIGLDPQALLKRMTSKKVTDKIEADMNLARHIGVELAPAAFLNGRRVPALCLNSEVFWHTIAQEMTAQANVSFNDQP